MNAQSSGDDYYGALLLLGLGSRSCPCFHSHTVSVFANRDQLGLVFSS